MKEIRILGRSDLLQIVKVVESWKETDQWKLGAYLWTEEYLSAELESSLGWGSFKENELQSFIFLKDLGDIYEITSISTQFSASRRGSMEKLLQFLIKESPAKVKEIWLEAHECNLAALKLYQKCQFKIAGQRPRYYSDVRHAVLLTHHR